ncbi:MAG: hypothetical protein J7K63_00640 [Candidatus Marinimicrobia bacterium]|nr:hypothetical protein [Candidatus Neomarinimicrobiota bacterium]
MSDILKKRKGKILGRVLVKGEFHLLSPLIIGTGTGDETDNDLQTDGMGLPFIPGSSWIGAVRALFESAVKSGDMDHEDMAKFLGMIRQNEEGQDYQSALIANDCHLIGHSPDIETRTNVRLDPVSRTAEEGALFNYQILSIKNQFRFGCELVIREGQFESMEQGLEYLDSMIQLLENGDISLGAKTNSGYGRVQLVQTEYCYFDFAGKPKMGKKWLSREFDWKKRELKPVHLPKLMSNDSVVNVRFKPETSLMIREKILDDVVDVRHLHSGGKPVLSGTSLKGVIRHQCLKILKTILPESHESTAEKMIQNMFGYVENDAKKLKEMEKKGELTAWKGHVSVSESELHYVKTSRQTRIRVDYFTGGVFESALFSEDPVRPEGKESYLETQIRLKKNPENALGKKNPENKVKNLTSLQELALILQAVKDMWTGWVPVGGESAIGRGTLKGEILTIQYNHRQLKISELDHKLGFEGDKSLLDELENAWKTLLDKEVAA